MKVAHVLKDLVVGGIQTLLLDVLNHYAKTGEDFIFIAIGDGELKSEFEKFGKKTFFLKQQLPFFDPFLIYKLRKILLKEKIDVVHAHYVSEGVSAFFSCLGLKIKTVQSFHSAPEILSSKDNWAFKKLAAYQDAGVVPSNAQLNKLKNYAYPIKKISVIHNGINPERFQKKSNRNIKDELGLKNGQILFGMAGNFYNDTRDQLTVCKALPEIFQKFPDVRFVFFGGHSNKHIRNSYRYDACVSFCQKNNISDKVIFAGVETDSSALFSALDYFVYSSLNDTFGMAVVEAMYNEIPVILNDLDVLKEVVSQDECAYFYPTGNEKALAEVVVNLLENPEKSINKVKNAKLLVTSDYNVKSHIFKLNLLYNKLILKS